MLTPQVLDTFVTMDTGDVVRVLRDHQLLDTDAGDAVLGYMAGNHPTRYLALLSALDRAEV
jgi:hypothetical protein